MECYNRRADGECLAYGKAAVCKNTCRAVMKTIDEKIKLLTALMNYSQAAKDKVELRRELEEAYKVKQAQMDGRYEDWMSCYLDDKHRGGGGGSSEHDANRSTSAKQLMKDNRALDTKLTKDEQAELREEIREWEEKNGKLERLSRVSMSHSKVDSYTGEVID